MFYNYSVIYFNQALELMKNNNDPKALKQALKFFRIGLWGFKECKKNVQNSTATGLLPPEFQTNDLDSAINLCEAYAYKCFFLLKPKFND